MHGNVSIGSERLHIYFIPIPDRYTVPVTVQNQREYNVYIESHSYFSRVGALTFMNLIHLGNKTFRKFFFYKEHSIGVYVHL